MKKPSSASRKANELETFNNWEKLSQKTKDFLETIDISKVNLNKLNISDARKKFFETQNAVETDLSGVIIHTKHINADGFTLSLEIVRPKSQTGTLPAFIFICGGGWVFGNFESHKRMIRDLVVESQCAGISINYTPSPESKYPQALTEIYAACIWIAQHAQELDIFADRIGLVGNSAGGNMAAAIAMMASAENKIKFRLLVLICPITSGVSRELSTVLPDIIHRFASALRNWVADQYARCEEDKSEIYFSPLSASLDQLSGLPRTFIQIAENDPLRAEAEAFGRKLDKAGVLVTTVTYNGVIHDFGLFNALSDLPQTRSLFAHSGAELKKYL
jgi:acetyl esterase/lipase